MEATTNPPSAPPSVAIHFPPRPLIKDIKSDSTATLKWLKPNLATLYLAGRTAPYDPEPPKIARNSYLDLYSVTYDYCMATTATGRGIPGGELLYRALQDEIRTHCSEVRAHLLGPEDDSKGVDGARHVLREYLAQWHRLTQLADLIAKLLGFLDRHWIKRAVDEGRKGIYSIKDLHTVVWKNEILQVGVDSSEAVVGSEIARSMAMLQNHGKLDGDTDLVERFLESLRTIGVGPGDVR